MNFHSFRVVSMYECRYLKNIAYNDLLAGYIRRKESVGYRNHVSLSSRLYCRSMWHELIIDKLVPQYGWGDQPPDCKGEDLNVSSFLVVYNTEPFSKHNWMADNGE